ncbi:nucleotidyltransferase family protein [Shewanella xiamenensis]|uniref:nucleotidyltransferase family protein n=1 Tax=Shewanella xiamenensis TaxID=332186 RepID=UPI00166C8454|nr:nucleotidyltransferase family protein [Shewanella xiamenensis]MCL1069944.1 nucleotidyltransferase family protein [Shewanella xiamenensis]WHF56847.1 nucleotidyltransferase family protein [Shewanella xiamenensis]GGM84940.1 mannose-1-phosphate guanylyltransferase [Shewanella xiamenensis]
MNNSWLRSLLTANDSILKAIEVLNNEIIKVVLVVDDESRLLGTITDGDIRRGILRGVSLASSVSEIMFTTPVTAPLGTSKKILAKMMHDKAITSIPLIENGKVVDLQTLSSVSKKFEHLNPVFLMAGGFGTRLRPLTDNYPKPLLNVGGRPILETILLSFIRAGFVNFYISVFYKPELIREHFGDGSKWGVNIQYIEENQPLGTGGALSLLPKNLPELPLVMMNGDILTNVDFERLLEFHNDNSAMATMCVRDYEYQVPYGVITGDGHHILSMEEKPVQRFFVNAGIYVLTPELVRKVEANTRIDMPTLLQNVIEEKKEVLMFPIHEYWLDIGRLDDFDRAQADIVRLGI